jgi:hypothetical protein
MAVGGSSPWGGGGVEAAVAASISRWSGGGAGGRCDMRQRGWVGGLGLAREGERMGKGEKKGAATGGAHFKRRMEMGNGSVEPCVGS